MSLDELDIWGQSVSPAAVSVLAESWYVSMVDPVGGRDDRLWPAVVAALDAEA